MNQKYLALVCCVLAKKFSISQKRIGVEKYKMCFVVRTVLVVVGFSSKFKLKSDVL